MNNLNVRGKNERQDPRMNNLNVQGKNKRQDAPAAIRKMGNVEVCETERPTTKSHFFLKKKVANGALPMREQRARLGRIGGDDLYGVGKERKQRKARPQSTMRHTCSSTHVGKSFVAR